MIVKHSSRFFEARRAIMVASPSQCSYRSSLASRSYCCHIGQLSVEVYGFSWQICWDLCSTSLSHWASLEVDLQGEIGNLRLLSMEAYHAVPRLLPLTRCGKKYAGPTFQICPEEPVPLKMKAAPQIGDRVLMPFSEDWQEAQNNGQTERVAIRLYRLFCDSKTHGSIGQRYLKASFFSSEFNFRMLNPRDVYFHFRMPQFSGILVILVRWYTFHTVLQGGVGLAFRRWRGRAGKTGFLLATVSGVAGFALATQRWELILGDVKAGKSWNVLTVWYLSPNWHKVPFKSF